MDIQPFQILNTRNEGNERATAELRISTKTGTVVLAPSAIARFWSKVDRRGENECWEWQGGANEQGYGRFRIDGRLYSPHRLAFEMVYGPVPKHPSYHGMVIMHTCDNPRCCNPTHLRLGFQRDNVQDMINKGRFNRRRGEKHPNAKLTPEIIRAIRADTRTEREIAAAYGLSKGTVSNIRLRKRWAHVR